jgi:hypothetical protein
MELTPCEEAVGRDRHNPMRLPTDLEEYIQRWLKLQGQPVPRQIIVCPASWDDIDVGTTRTYLAGLFPGVDEQPEEWRPM